MVVVIGVDPHKGSPMPVALDANEQDCASLHVRSGPRQLSRTRSSPRSSTFHVGFLALTEPRLFLRLTAARQSPPNPSGEGTGTGNSIPITIAGARRCWRDERHE